MPARFGMNHMYCKKIAADYCSFHSPYKSCIIFGIQVVLKVMDGWYLLLKCCSRALREWDFTRHSTRSTLPITQSRDPSGWPNLGEKQAQEVLLLQKGNAARLHITNDEGAQTNDLLSRSGDGKGSTTQIYGVRETGRSAGPRLIMRDTGESHRSRPEFSIESIGKDHDRKVDLKKRHLVIGACQENLLKGGTQHPSWPSADA